MSHEAGMQWKALSDAEKQWWTDLAKGNITTTSIGSQGAKRAANQEDTASSRKKKAKGDGS